jgi:hypothetical protein
MAGYTALAALPTFPCPIQPPDFLLSKSAILQILCAFSTTAVKEGS